MVWEVGWEVWDMGWVEWEDTSSCKDRRVKICIHYNQRLGMSKIPGVVRCWSLREKGSAALLQSTLYTALHIL